MKPTHLCTLLIVLLSTMVFGSGCQKNAATGERTLLLLSSAEEARLGSEAAPQFTAEYGGPVDDAELNQYVTRIGKRLAAVTEADYPDLEWEFTLLDSSVINAFALPGGKVFITRGLAERLSNEAQLAGVLGHEVGHVTAQHANRRISKQMGINAVLTGVTAVVTGADPETSVGQYGSYAVPALQLGSSLVLLKYGRDEEIQADALGLRYMSRIGYDPRAQADVMRVLAEVSQGGARQPEFLSTHPYPETRIAQIDDLIRSDYQGVLNSGDVDTYDRRYERQFLSRLRQLPRPKHGGAQAMIAPGFMGFGTAHGMCGCCSGPALIITTKPAE